MLGPGLCKAEEGEGKCVCSTSLLLTVDGRDQVLASLSPQWWTITWDSRPKRPFYPRTEAKVRTVCYHGPQRGGQLLTEVSETESKCTCFLCEFITALEGWLSQNSAQLSGATKQNPAQITECPVNLPSWAGVSHLLWSQHSEAEIGGLAASSTSAWVT